MALPTFVAAGVTKSATIGVPNVQWPGGHQSGDFGLLVVQTSAEAPANNPPAGWTQIPTVSPQTIGVAATAGSVRISAFYRIATSNAEADVDIGDSGDHQIAVITVWRGVDTSSPFDANAGATAATSTAMSCPTVTTTGADRLIICIFGHAVDSTTNPLSAITNAGLANISNRKNSVSTVGTGGGFTVASGEKATAGATGATTATLSVTSAQALITLSLKPPTGGSSPFGGFYVATGGKAVAGDIGASTGNLQTAQVQAALTIALKPPTPVTNNPPVLDTLPDLLAPVNEVLDFTVGATDPDGGALTFTLFPGLTVVPSGLTISPTTGQILWTPAFFFQGVWNITVRVTDNGGLTDEQTINITVTGGPASAIQIADRAQADYAAMEALLALLLQQQQLNAAVITKTQEVLADIGIAKDFIDAVIDDLNAQGT